MGQLRCNSHQWCCCFCFVVVVVNVVVVVLVVVVAVVVVVIVAVVVLVAVDVSVVVMEYQSRAWSPFCSDIYIYTLFDFTNIDLHFAPINSKFPPLLRRLRERMNSAMLLRRYGSVTIVQLR